MKKFTFLLIFVLMAFSYNGWSQVFITELADPNNESGARFVEIYNAGTTSIDFSTGWQLQRATNGNTYWQTAKNLTGTIAAGGFYLVCANQTTFTSTYGFAADQNIGTGGPADSNGDDQIRLLSPGEVVEDMFGVLGEDGSGTNHEFEDGRAEKKATVTTGNTTYTFSEWNIWNDTGGSGTTNDPQNAPDDFDPGAWIGAVIVIDPEPSNYPTSLTATATGLAIDNVWIDATGTQLPSAYLVLISDQDNISAPVDGVFQANDTDISDGSGALNIFFGNEACTFFHLLSETTYFFEIYPYTNTGTNVDYKTDGSAPQASATTDYAINVEYFEVDLGSWTEHSIIGDQIWYQDTYYNGDTYAKVSGYLSGSHENEDWLISPALNLDGFVEEIFRFTSAMNYSGPDLEVLISEDYDGTSNPNSASWNVLNPVLSSGSFAWTESGAVDISSFIGSAVYIAFKYISTSSNSSTWEIDNIEVTGNFIPEISVVAPTVGVQWQVGSSYDIEWTAANTSGNVKIELTTNASGGNPSWTEIAAAVPAQQQSWTWNIPASQVASPDCKIRITEIDYSVSDESGIFRLIESIAIPNIVITEIMYNPPESGNDSIEFIELFNNDATTVDLEGYYFSDGIEFTFPSTEIAPGEYVLVTINADAMMNTFGVTALQWTDGGLSNGGELIQLVNENGTVVDFVEYDNAEPWPTACDGTGPSLTLCDPDSDNSLVENWSASINLAAVNANSDNIYATPGSACVQEPVAEFVADTTIVIVDGVVNFTDLSEGSIDTWSWIFDGGTPATSNLQNPPEIVYNAAGTYTVTLTVENEAGTSTNTKTDYISVGIAPIVDFEADNVNILEGESVNFTDLSIGTPDTWEWIFEGGTPNTSSAQNPTLIQYNTMGSYDVTLNISNMFGVSSITKTDYINVEPIGIYENDLKEFNIYPNPNNGNFFVEFKVNTENEISIYSLIGELVYSKVINKSVSEINLSQLNNGVYFIIVYDKNAKQLTTKKLVIQ